jgi:peptidoglycan biosynthesis protein MviN/MurJ (putative lipid II flippase)
MVNQIIAAAIHVGLSLLLVNRMGFVGAGIATLVGYVALTALQAHGSRRFLTWQVPWRSVRNVAVACAGMALAVYVAYFLTGDRTGGAHLGFLLLSVGTGIIVYAGLLLALGEAQPEERQMAAQWWGRLRRWPARHVLQGDE